MSSETPSPRSLPGVLETVWSELEIGAARAKHGFHQPILSTVDLQGEPSSRVVVLRHADRNAGTVACHTDARSPKVEHIRSAPTAAWCFYDATRRIQIRATGTCSIHSGDQIADERWDGSPTRSRRCYLAPSIPGERCESPSPNLPIELHRRDPSEAESQAGRVNFAVIRCTLRKLDYLELHHDGHVRATFTRQDGGPWSGHWTEV